MAEATKESLRGAEYLRWRAHSARRGAAGLAVARHPFCTGASHPNARPSGVRSRLSTTARDLSLSPKKPLLLASAPPRN